MEVSVLLMVPDCPLNHFFENILFFFVFEQEIVLKWFKCCHYWFCRKNYESNHWRSDGNACYDSTNFKFYSKYVEQKFFWGHGVNNYLYGSFFGEIVSTNLIDINFLCFFFWWTFWLFLIILMNFFSTLLGNFWLNIFDWLSPDFFGNQRSFLTYLFGEFFRWGFLLKVFCFVYLCCF